jgi:hypothetical protein
MTDEQIMAIIKNRAKIETYNNRKYKKVRGNKLWQRLLS